MKDYKKINQHSWDQKVDLHIKSDFYNMDSFLKGESSLNSIELDLLGDITNKSILHLQCHFGQDSISLSRMGAQVTGIDLSPKAIEKAKEIAKECEQNTQFIVSDVFDVPNNVEGEFDLVFTSYGTIGWLPNLDKWAETIEKKLKKGGRFIMAEFHPVVWMFDDNFTQIEFSYFNQKIIEGEETGTYASEKEITLPYMCWNHSLEDVISALLKKGLTLKKFQEFDYSPYPCFSNTKEIAPKKYIIDKFDGKIPMVYALVMEK
jgi:2-polyprenyl-3-methyl-5-hydroxy-6-metoxy-1,4-benzoquinol methylase